MVGLSLFPTFETLTGKLPYEADTPMGVIVKHITEPVPRILDVKIIQVVAA